MSEDREGGYRRRGGRRAPVKGRGLGLKHVKLDYKDPDSLRRYIMEHGRIRPPSRRNMISGTRMHTR